MFIKSKIKRYYCGTQDITKRIYMLANKDRVSSLVYAEPRSLVMLDSRDNLQTINTINIDFVFTIHKDSEYILDFLKYIFADYPADTIFSMSEYVYAIFPVLEVYDYYCVRDIHTGDDYVILDFDNY